MGRDKEETTKPLPEPACFWPLSKLVSPPDLGVLWAVRPVPTETDVLRCTARAWSMSSSVNPGSSGVLG